MRRFVTQVELLEKKTRGSQYLCSLPWIALCSSYTSKNDYKTKCAKKKMKASLVLGLSCKKCVLSKFTLKLYGVDRHIKRRKLSTRYTHISPISRRRSTSKNIAQLSSRCGMKRTSSVNHRCALSGWLYKRNLHISRHLTLSQFYLITSTLRTVFGVVVFIVAQPCAFFNFCYTTDKNAPAERIKTT